MGVTSSEKLLHSSVTEAIIGGCFAVHSELGSGFLESVYANALAVVLRNAGLTVEREVPYEVFYHGVSVGLYRADLVVESKVVVEVKTARTIDDAHMAQLRNYLRASGLAVGLALSFGAKAQFRRVVCERQKRSLTSSHTS